MAADPCQVQAVVEGMRPISSRLRQAYRDLADLPGIYRRSGGRAGIVGTLDALARLFDNERTAAARQASRDKHRPREEMTTKSRKGAGEALRWATAFADETRNLSDARVAELRDEIFLWTESREPEAPPELLKAIPKTVAAVQAVRGLFAKSGASQADRGLFASRLAASEITGEANEADVERAWEIYGRYGGLYFPRAYDLDATPGRANDNLPIRRPRGAPPSKRLLAHAQRARTFAERVVSDKAAREIGKAEMERLNWKSLSEFKEKGGRTDQENFWLEAYLNQEALLASDRFAGAVLQHWSAYFSAEQVKAGDPERLGFKRIPITVDFREGPLATHPFIGAITPAWQALRGTQPQAGKPGKAQGGIFVHKSVAGELEAMMIPQNIMLELHDAVVNVWKEANTNANPGFHMHNLLGQAIAGSWSRFYSLAFAPGKRNIFAVAREGLVSRRAAEADPGEAVAALERKALDAGNQAVAQAKEKVAKEVEAAEARARELPPEEKKRIAAAAIKKAEAKGGVSEARRKRIAADAVARAGEAAAKEARQEVERRAGVSAAERESIRANASWRLIERELRGATGEARKNLEAVRERLLLDTAIRLGSYKKFEPRVWFEGAEAEMRGAFEKHLDALLAADSPAAKFQAWTRVLRQMAAASKANKALQRVRDLLHALSSETDQMYRYGVFRDQVLRLGKSFDEAAAEVDATFANYDTIPHMVRQVGRFRPFLAFNWAMTGIASGHVAKALAAAADLGRGDIDKKKAWEESLPAIKMFALMPSLYGLTHVALAYQGYNEEEIEAWRKSTPSLDFKLLGVLPMSGGLAVPGGELNMTYSIPLPWIDVFFGGNIGQPLPYESASGTVTEWAGNIVEDIGASDPAISFIFESVAFRDFFTGKPLSEPSVSPPGDLPRGRATLTPEEKMAYIAWHGFHKFVPYWVRSVEQYIQDREMENVSRTGPKRPALGLLASIGGSPYTNLNLDEAYARLTLQARSRVKEIDEAIRKLSYDMGRNKVSREKGARVLRKLVERRRAILYARPQVRPRREREAAAG